EAEADANAAAVAADRVEGKDGRPAAPGPGPMIGSAPPARPTPEMQASAAPTPVPAPAIRVPPSPATHQAPVWVRLLGTFTITARAQAGSEDQGEGQGTPHGEGPGAGEVRTGLRSKARELLAYALCHPDGFTAEQAIEAL